jgi:hypothetical protein
LCNTAPSNAYPAGRPLTTYPFFMALILAQQKTIERLRAQVQDTKL